MESCVSGGGQNDQNLCNVSLVTTHYTREAKAKITSNPSTKDQRTIQNTKARSE